MAEVPLTVVSNDLEAEMLCGMLQANGISCSRRSAGFIPGLYGGPGGSAISGQATPTEIFVEETQLAAAQELLRDSQ